VTSRLRPLQRTAGILLAAGVLALAYAAYVVVDARVSQTNQHRQLEQERQRAPVMEPAVMAPLVTAPLVDGDTIGEIEIPRLGIAVSVVQGESPTVLQRAVGHLADTALPGEMGNVVLAGHRDTFFRPLKGVKVGDAITMKTRDGDVTYEVESTRVVPPTDLSVLDSTGGRTLTLITCFPFSYVGSAPNRFIVRARETGNTTRTPPGVH
jgi:sortase A